MAATWIQVPANRTDRNFPHLAVPLCALGSQFLHRCTQLVGKKQGAISPDGVGEIGMTAMSMAHVTATAYTVIRVRCTRWTCPWIQALHKSAPWGRSSRGIARAANRVDQLRAETGVGLASEAADGNIDHVRVAVAMDVPDEFGNLVRVGISPCRRAIKASRLNSLAVSINQPPPRRAWRRNSSSSRCPTRRDDTCCTGPRR